MFDLTRVLPRQLRPLRPRSPDIVTASGLSITFDETAGAEALTLETPGGQRLRLQDGPGRVTLEDSNGNQVALGTSGVTVTCAAALTVQASTLRISAGTIQLDAAMTVSGGVLQCETLVADSVVAQSYTPGAGNIW